MSGVEPSNTGRLTPEILPSDNGNKAVSTITESFKRLVGVKKDPLEGVKKVPDSVELHGDCSPAVPQGDKDTGKEIATSPKPKIREGVNLPESW